MAFEWNQSIRYKYDPQLAVFELSNSIVGIERSMEINYVRKSP